MFSDTEIKGIKSKSCATYLFTVKSLGFEIDLKYLMSEGEAILLGEKEISEKYQKQIKQLSKFYQKGYEDYFKQS